MNISKFFIDRPIFAGVLSLIIFIGGAIAMNFLPISEYPEVVPPSVVVTAQYPGANPKTISETVATPLEEQINGVENMLYMSSQATTDGLLNITITFKLGTDPDLATQLVQNRVAQAQPRLPEEVRRYGVTTAKSSPNFIMVVHITSPDDRYDQLYLRNYTTINIKDRLARIQGVGQTQVFGGGDYSMRIWLNPEKVAARGLNASEVVNAIREQNIQVAAGSIGAPPYQGHAADFQIPISAQGRLQSEEQFGEIIIKNSTTKPGQPGVITRLKDVARLELGGATYAIRSLLDNKQAVGVGIFQAPGSNSLEVSQNVRATMKELQKNFPEGVSYEIAYDPTTFVRDSINAVVHTLLEAIALVVLVVIVFLQTWRASIIPLLAVPVSIVGTFALLLMFGFSINALSLFGLVLAIGIVVDDAIVVVENVERNIEEGLSPREATYRAMQEVSGPIIAIALTLCAVFVPIAFISGLTGQFYRQFALTIALSTIISAFNSLTLSPALAAILLRSHHAPKDKFTLLIERVFGGFFTAIRWYLIAIIILLAGKLLQVIVSKTMGYGAVYGILIYATEILSGLAVVIAVVLTVLAILRPKEGHSKGFDRFNRFFERSSEGYSRKVRQVLGNKTPAMIVYVVLIGLTWVMFHVVPGGFVPSQDKQYLVGFAQLQEGASLERTEAVIRRMSDIAMKEPGVKNAVAFPGLSINGFTASSSAGIVFCTLDDFSERTAPNLSAGAIAGSLNGKFAQIQDALVLMFPPPPVMGLGTVGGFKLQIEDRTDQGFEALDSTLKAVMGKAYQTPELAGVFSSYKINVPQLEADLDRAKAKQQGLGVSEVYDAMATYLGSTYVNDFNRFGRTYQVIAQADAPFRDEASDIGRLKVRNSAGTMVPISTVMKINQSFGPESSVRYNAYRAADLNGNPGPGYSSGQAQEAITRILKEVLPRGMDFEWTDLTYQQILAGDTAMYVFPLCVLLVFMVLAAQYESLALPLAVILIVPMCLLCAIFGVWISGLLKASGSDNNIFTQIGLIVLVGLACKNAILIVEFARELELQGKKTVEAAIEACRLRLRPILMTSFAFIMGTIPLVISTGAGAEMRQAMGIAVFSGMLGVTFFGLILTPVFYVILRTLAQHGKDTPPPGHAHSGTHTIHHPSI